MLRLTKSIKHTLSVRLSLMIVLSMAVLLMASLVVMVHYSRNVVKNETLQNASQTLDGMVQHVDNILLGIEQTAGNTYLNILPHLDSPDVLEDYCRELLSNANIAGCAIALEQGYYEKDKLFMVYYCRMNDGVSTYEQTIAKRDAFGDTPYTSQKWFYETMGAGRPQWINPTLDTKYTGEPLLTFALPIYNREGRTVGVLGVDVSLSRLTKIVLGAKPSPNSYCVLLERDGKFIVHPNSYKLNHETVFTQTLSKDTDPSVKLAAEAMISGETGYKPFRMDGADYLVFYKPFKRIAVPGRYLEDLGWSAGIIYSNDDVFGRYNQLIYWVFGIAVTGLLLLLVLTQMFIHRQLLPLLLLTESAKNIAGGNFNETVPDCRQQDEIGSLQKHFQQMQQALAVHVGQLRALQSQLETHGDHLRKAYVQAKQADRMKIAFLHNMTNQMIEPAQTIDSDIQQLCREDCDMTSPEAAALVDNVREQGSRMAGLLNDLLKMSDDSLRKEVTDEE